MEGDPLLYSVSVLSMSMSLSVERKIFFMAIVHFALLMNTMEQEQLHFDVSIVYIQFAEALENYP